MPEIKVKPREKETPEPEAAAPKAQLSERSISKNQDLAKSREIAGDVQIFASSRQDSGPEFESVHVRKTSRNPGNNAMDPSFLALSPPLHTVNTPVTEHKATGLPDTRLGGQSLDDMLCSRESKDRLSGAKALLGSPSSEEAQGYMPFAVKDEDPKVRAGILKIMGEQPEAGKTFAAEVRQGCRDEDAGVRAQALESLVKLKDPAAPDEAFRMALHDREDHAPSGVAKNGIQLAAVRALGEMGQHEKLHQLCDPAVMPHASVRARALFESLKVPAKPGSPEADAQLKLAVLASTDPNPRVQQTMAALARKFDPKDMAASGVYENLAKNEDPSVKMTLMATLVNAKDPVAKAHLEKLHTAGLEPAVAATYVKVSEPQSEPVRKGFLQGALLARMAARQLEAGGPRSEVADGIIGKLTPTPKRLDQSEAPKVVATAHESQVPLPLAQSLKGTDFKLKSSITPIKAINYIGPGMSPAMAEAKAAMARRAERMKPLQMEATHSVSSVGEIVPNFPKAVEPPLSAPKEPAVAMKRSEVQEMLAVKSRQEAASQTGNTLKAAGKYGLSGVLAGASAVFERLLAAVGAKELAGHTKAFKEGVTVEGALQKVAMKDAAASATRASGSWLSIRAKEAATEVGARAKRIGNEIGGGIVDTVKGGHRAFNAAFYSAVTKPFEFVPFAGKHVKAFRGELKAEFNAGLDQAGKGMKMPFGFLKRTADSAVARTTLVTDAVRSPFIAAKESMPAVAAGTVKGFAKLLFGNSHQEFQQQMEEAHNAELAKVAKSAAERKSVGTALSDALKALSPFNTFEFKKKTA